MPIIDLHTHSEVAVLPESTVIVLGFFDGVHIGHRALFDKAKILAQKQSAGVSVWTFGSMPRSAAQYLTTIEEKCRLFAECGVDYVVLEDFESLKSLEGEDFFHHHIMEKYAPAAVVCGFNFKFGKGAACNSEDLCKLAQECGVTCSIVPEQTEGGETVSATRIRTLIKSGRLKEANHLLGSPYSITSVIEHGVQIGRKMGVRTINQRLPENKVCPKLGVYACTVTFHENDGKSTYGGVCNIGCRPTVNKDSSDVTVETHIFDFDGEVYGDRATVKLYSMLREEKEFPDLDSLKEAISQDARKSNEILKNIL